MPYYKTVTKTFEVEIKPSEAAKWFAESYSTEQAEFFSHCAAEFERIGEGRDLDGMQMLYIKDSLCPKAREFIKKLYYYTVDDDEQTEPTALEECHCADKQGGPCSFCMEKKHGL